MIVSSLGVDVSQCVYVGDSPSDGRAACAAGMRSVGVGYGSHRLAFLEEEGGFSEGVWETVEEVFEVLRGIT